MEQGIGQLGMAKAQVPAAAIDQVGRARHGFKTARNEQLPVPGADGLGGRHGRLQTRAADLVKRGRADAGRQPGKHGRLAGGGLSLASLDNIAEQNFIDFFGIFQPGALDRRFDGNRPQPGGRD